MTIAILNLAVFAAAITAGLSGAPTTAASLAGDWVLDGESTAGRLKLSPNGKDLTLSLRNSISDAMREEYYQVSGTLGAALTFDRVGASTPLSEGKEPLLRPRARLLPISATIALWWQPHRRAVFAYRSHVVPQALQGKYTIDQGQTDIRTIEIRAETFVCQHADNDDPSAPIRIAAVTDADEESMRVVLGDTASREVWRIELHGHHAQLVQEIGDEQDTVLDAQFVAAASQRPDGDTKDARAGAHRNASMTTSSPRDEELPTLGNFRFVEFARNYEAALTISPFEWALRPLGGSTGQLGAAEVTRKLADGATRLMLRLAYRSAIILRPIEGDVWILDLYGKAFVMYRPDTPPAWAPVVGLSDDVRLLCRELDAAGSRLDDGMVRAAFERVGRSARSDVMRSLVEAIVPAPADFRATLLEHGLADSGEPIPSCPGVDRLRTQPGRRKGPPSDD
jgi:hypothetical protein